MCLSRRYYRVKTVYSIEGMDGRVYHKVWKKRHARHMVNSREIYGFPNEGICYKITKRGHKVFCFMW